MNRLISDTSVIDLIPEVLRNDPDIIAASKSADDLFSEAVELSRSVRVLTDIEGSSNEVLEHLLWQFHMTNKEGAHLASTREDKIRLIRYSIDLHRKKGTPYAIERVLEAVGLNGNVEEWFEYDGSPYWFLVELSTNNKFNQINDVEKLILEYKNKRSWFEGFVILYDEMTLIIIDDTYNYPVYYRLTGKFWGEKEFNQLRSGSIFAIDDTYDYKIKYPTSKKDFLQIDSDSVVTIDDTYDYPQVYRKCGEMSTLKKETELTEHLTTLMDDSYSYQKEFRLCGKFSVEG